MSHCEDYGDSFAMLGTGLAISQENNEKFIFVRLLLCYIHRNDKFIKWDCHATLAMTL